MYKIYQLPKTEKYDYNKFLSQISSVEQEKINLELENLIKHNITYENTHLVNTEREKFYVHAIAKKYQNKIKQTIIFGIAERV